MRAATQRIVTRPATWRPSLAMAPSPPFSPTLCGAPGRCTGAFRLLRQDPAAEDLEEAEGPRHRDVEGADVAPHGNPDELVAPLAHQGPQARPFRAHHHHQPGRQLHLPEVPGSSGIKPHHPEARLLELDQGPG